jgi:hypothetical protein
MSAVADKADNVAGADGVSGGERMAGVTRAVGSLWLQVYVA